MRLSKVNITLFLVSFVLTGFAVWIFSHYKENSPNVLLKQGFDFRKLRLENSGFANPKIGEKINLSNLKDAEGKHILLATEKKFLLIIVINPLCKACNFSNDMMKEIRKTTKDLNIEYYPAVSVPTLANANTEKYIHNLGFNNWFTWSPYSPELNPLSNVVTPTHILLDRQGIILQVWFGSNQNKEIRKRMSEQISSDLFLINDVTKAVLDKW